MAYVTIKRGDTGPPIVATLSDSKGIADLTNASGVRFHMLAPGAPTPLVNRPATILSPPTAGKVQYNWQAGDTTTAGDFLGEFEVTFSDGTIETFPNEDQIPVLIREDLDSGPVAPSAFITVEELGAFIGHAFVDELERAQALSAIEDASAAIRRHTNQVISRVANDQITLDPISGSGYALILPERPVVAVSAVSLEGAALTLPNDIVFYENGELYRAGYVDRSWRYGDPWLFSTGPLATLWGRPWGWRAQSVAVTYTHGYATIPPDIKKVCKGLAARTLANPMNVAREWVSDVYRVEYALNEPPGGFNDSEEEILGSYTDLVIA